MRVANAFVVWDCVRVAIGSAGHWLLVRGDHRCTMVQRESSTLGGATWGSTLGGGAGGVTVGGVLMCLAVGAVKVCMLVECSSARRASMTGCVRGVGEGSIEALEAAEEFVCHCECWAWEVVVPEVDGVADGQCAGVLYEHLVAPIVFCSRVDVESFPTVVVP